MEREQKRNKKGLVGPVVIVICVLTLGVLAFFVFQTNRNFTKIDKRIQYLQDSLRILQSDMTNMKEEIATKLEEENSLLEQHRFELVDMDFAKNTYTLNMTIIPKDYSKETKVSVYFGTNEYELEAGEFFFSGTAVLPFDDSFAGNVTVLLKNGEQKNTEVLHSYDGYVNDFSAMLKATAMGIPSIKDGKVTGSAPARLELDGKNRFKFVSCELIAEVDGNRVFSRDYFKYKEYEKNTDSILDYEVTGDGEIETNYEAVEKYQWVDGAKMVFNVEKDAKVKIYVEAKTSDGYVFDYNVFEGTVDEKAQGFNEESVSLKSESRMTDKHGNVKEFYGK